MRSPLHLSHSSGTSGTISSVSLGLSAAAAPGSVSLLALEVEPTSARRRLGVGLLRCPFFGVVTGGSTAASWRQMQQVLASWSSSSSSRATFRLPVLEFSSGFSTYFFRAALLVLTLSLMAVL